MNKLVIIKSGGSLPIRGGINGPILTPISLDLKDIVTLLNKFKDVYEVNPYTGEQIKLTRTNCTTENFKKVVHEVVSTSEMKEEPNTEPPQKKDETDKTDEKVTVTDVVSETKTEEVKPAKFTAVKEQPKKEDMKRIDNDFVSNSKRKK